MNAINGLDLISPILESLKIPYKGQAVRKVTVIMEVDAAVIIEVAHYMHADTIPDFKKVIMKYEIKEKDATDDNK